MAVMSDPLLRAVVLGDARTVESLLLGGADVRQLYSNYKQSLVYWAASYAASLPANLPRTTLLKLLVEKYKLEASPLDTNGQTPLFYAAKSGIYEACDYLIAQRSDPGHLDNIASQTPLFYAALNCRTDCVTLLIERKCPVDQADVNGRTALFFAGNAGVVLTLASSGCNLDALDNQHNTAAIVHTKFGQSEQLAALIEARADLNIAAQDRKTCWQIAAQNKSTEVYKVLERMVPPLTKAVRARKKVAVPMPVEARTVSFASSSSAPPPGGTGGAVAGIVSRIRTRSVKAAEERATAVAPTTSELAQSPESTAAPASPPSAVWPSQLNNPSAVVVTRCKCWVFRESGKVDLGASLDASVKSGSADDVREVLKVITDYSISPNTFMGNAGGRTWITYAACREYGAVPICMALHEFGVDPLKVDDLGQTALFYAVRKSVPPNTSAGVECARWLLDMKCDPDQMDRNRERPLDYASRNDNPDCAAELIRAGADINHVSGHTYYSALCTAIGSDNVETARVLLEAKCDPNFRMPKRDGTTAIFFAQSVDALDLLLEYGADLNARDDVGRTPLITAAYNAGLVIVKALVKRKADVNALDKRGETCLTWSAVKGDCIPVCKFLIKECGMNSDALTRMGPTVAQLIESGERLAEIYEMDRMDGQQTKSTHTILNNVRRRPAQPPVNEPQEVSSADEDVAPCRPRLNSYNTLLPESSVGQAGAPQPTVMRPTTSSQSTPPASWQASEALWSTPPPQTVYQPAPMPQPSWQTPLPLVVQQTPTRTKRRAIESPLGMPVPTPAGTTGLNSSPPAVASAAAARRAADKAALLDVNEKPTLGTRLCTIGFKDDNGNLMEIGSPAYMLALRELIELCPELQVWDKMEMVTDNSSIVDDSRWVDLGSQDDSEDLLETM